MKNHLKSYWWIYLIIVLVIIAVIVYIIYKPAKTNPTVVNPKTTDTTSSIVSGVINGVGGWLSNLFGGSGSGGSSDCTPGLVSADDQCIDTCGFPISSDINPACL